MIHAALARLPRVARVLPTIAWTALFLALFGPAALQHYTFGTTQLRFHDDARIQVFPFHRYLEPEAWTGDYVGDYALALIPIGHRGLMALGSHFVHADRLAIYIGYAAFVLTLLIVAWTARRLAHRGAGFVAAAIMVSSSLLMERVVSGLPRAFAFPVMALALLWTVEGRVKRLAVLVVVGASLYPVVGVATGVVLSVLLLGLPAADRGEAETWSLRRRLALLAVTALLSAVMLAPTILATRPYGGRVTTADIPTFPEAGTQGTHGNEDRPPYPALLAELQPMGRRTLIGEGDPLWTSLRRQLYPWEEVIADAAMVLGLLGLLLAARQRVELRRVLAFAVGAALAHVLARAAAPYFYAPSRYLLYAWVPGLAVLLPVGFDALARGTTQAVARPWLHRGLGLLLGAALLCTLGGRGSDTRGLTINVKDEDAPLYRAIAALPPTTLVAGWPDDPMSNVPLLSRRRALMTGELHLGYHKLYLLEVRRRLRLFMDAYFASDTGPIFALRDQLGVTHLWLDPRHLRGPSAPGYMPPLGAYAKEVADRNRPRGFELLRQLERAKVAENARFVIIDLARLEPHAPEPLAPPEPPVP